MAIISEMQRNMRRLDRQGCPQIVRDNIIKYGYVMWLCTQV